MEIYLVIAYFTFPLKEYLSGGFPQFCLGGKENFGTGNGVLELSGVLTSGISVGS